MKKAELILEFAESLLLDVTATKNLTFALAECIEFYYNDEIVYVFDDDSEIVFLDGRFWTRIYIQ